jgi:hypothetical protein
MCIPIPSLAVDFIFCVETQTENIMGLYEKVVNTKKTCYVE